MSKLHIAILAAIMAVALLPSQSWASTNLVVGTCAKGTQFTTIQEAVDHAAAGATIEVCPGNYPEAVTIHENLTLKGITSGTAAAAVIAQPAAGIPVNATSGIFGNLTAQVLVQSASNVTISNIAIDGGGSYSCSSTSHWIGILYQGAGGTLTNSTVLDAPQCLNSIATFADATTNLKITNNFLSGCAGTCMEIDYATNTTVSGNTIEAFQNTDQGIEIQQLDGPATISNNVISGNMQNGCLNVFYSAAVTITGNTMMSPMLGFGILLLHTTNNVIENNRLSGGLPIAVNDQGQVGGNIITKNTVIAASCGLSLINANGDTYSPNTYFSSGQTVCTY